MRKWLHILAALLSLCFFPSCLQEVEEEAAFRENEPVDLTLHFGPVDAMDITVDTRSTLGLEQESRVNNLYIFIFDAGGKKLYGHFFDGSNYSADSEGNWWEVSNLSVAGGVSQTSGTIHLKTVTKHDCTIVGIANINVNMLDLSPGQLSTVQSLSRLESLKVGLNHLDIENSGYFLMTGRMDDVDIVKDDAAAVQQISGSLLLRRLESKIQFNVQVAPGAPITMFSPSKWQVVNLPRTAYLMERGSYAGYLDGTEVPEDAGTQMSEFSDSGEKNFESQKVTSDYYSGSDQNHIIRHSFSFYMMENRFAPLTDVTSYADRDRQLKVNNIDHGSFTTVENGAFEYADPRSAYVIITGKLVMDMEKTTGFVGTALDADVRYVIHLGDFGRSNGDFNVFRNHNYIYNIYIQGVSDIVAEVEANYDADSAHRTDENEPGASGKVAVALEEIFITDAHYSSHVITFHAKNLDADNITWYVETPFNPGGARPTVVNGEDITDGIDYEWVEFRVNDMDANGVYFNDRRQIYHPRNTGYGTMNVSELVKFLKRQRQLYSEDVDHWDEPGYVRKSMFDNERDQNGQIDPKIAVTAFVNEYYYEEDPRDHTYKKDLWKEFVNKPMRYMHILSQTRTSADGESVTFGSSFTIQQYSIQSIYNISNSGLTSAWGLEYTDDELESGATHYWKGYNKGKSSVPAEDRGNTSVSNGRLNTMKEWLLLDKNGADLHIGQENDELALWSTYLNMTAENTTPLLRKDAEADYRYLRYSCLSRNRDNNGNGIIDQDEVRWYMGSDTQLMGLFMGSYGIEGAARLYQVSAEDQLSNDRNVWRQHVIASTRYPGRTDSNVNARVIWAEEGLCGSDLSYYGASDGSTDVFSTRCVRNLGYYEKDGQPEDITHADPTVEPDPYIVVTRMQRNSDGDGIPYPTGNYNTSVYYDVDCSRLNTASLREYQNHELVAHDENNKAACLYDRFISAPVSMAPEVPTTITFEGKTYEPRYARQMNQYLDATWGIVDNPFCPEGYRLCNVREDAVLWNFISSSDRSNYFKGMLNHSRTHWYFGVDGGAPKSGLTSWGWTVNKDKIMMANARKDDQRTTSLRCVKDMKE